MGRARRLHVPGGTYYLRLTADSGRRLFDDREDTEEFARLVEAALDRCDARLYAFSWTQEHARFAVQISEVPLGDFVHLISGPYSRRVHKRLGRKGNLFARYQAVLILSENYVLRLIRYIHLSPVAAGLVADPAEHEWSSHKVYLRESDIPWVTPSFGLKLLARRGGKALDAYRRFMEEGLSPTDESRFEGKSAYLPRVGISEDSLESRAIDDTSSQLARLDALVGAAALALQIPREDVVSRTKRRQVTLARSLIAWHATRSGIASLSDVARYFGLHPSTLSEGMRRYTAANSELFRQSLAELVSGLGKR